MLVSVCTIRSYIDVNDVTPRRNANTCNGFNKKHKYLPELQNEVVFSTCSGLSTTAYNTRTWNWQGWVLCFMCPLILKLRQILSVFWENLMQVFVFLQGVEEVNGSMSYSRLQLIKLLI